MYYYFSCDYPAVVKINGVYYGSIFNTIKPLRINGNPPFIEVCPLQSASYPLNFIPDGEFLNSPPPFTSVTDLKGGYLIKFYKAHNQLPFGVIKQEKLNDAIVTVFTENSLKLSIETPNDFYAETFNLPDCGADIFRFNQNGQSLVAVCFKSQTNILCVYSLTNPIKKVFCREVFEFSIENGLKSVEKFNDLAKHTLSCEWEFCDGVYRKRTADLTCADGFDLTKLNEKLLPYAFFERLLAGGALDGYLTDDMLKNADKLQGYLGEFTGVFPPPAFREIDQVGLIYPQTDNKYLAEYYKCEIVGGKINNITKID